MQGRNAWFQRKYDLFTIYLIPGITISLVSFGSWTGTNLFALGSRAGNKLLFAVWGFTTGIYYCAYAHYLFHIEGYRNPGGGTLMHTTTAFLLMVVMIPCIPERYPLRTDFHMLLAFFSPVLLAFSTIGFPRFPGSRDRMRSRRAWGVLWMMVTCSVLFLLEAGFIASPLRIFIITELCGYLHYMEQLLAAQK